MCFLTKVKGEEHAEEKMEEEAGQYVLVGNLAQISMAAVFWREWRAAGHLRKKKKKDKARRLLLVGH